jgi:hypothetical protein
MKKAETKQPNKPKHDRGCERKDTNKNTLGQKAGRVFPSDKER